MKSNNAPKLADRFLKWFCKPELFESIQGDLHEYYERISNRWFSHVYYWLQVLQMLRPFAIKRQQSFFFIHLTLFRINTIISVRNLKRKPLYTTINLFGLATGLACCMLIALYVKEEISVDMHWKDADRIYRATTEISYGDTHSKTAYATAPIALLFEKEFPEVEVACRWVASPDMTFKSNEAWIKQDNILLADQTFFEVFEVEVMHGNISSALTAPNTIVITESTATKFFGRSDAVGQTLEANDGTIYQITAVIRDLPQNTHFNASMIRTTINDYWSDPSKHPLVTYWTGSAYRTFVKLKEGEDPRQLEDKFDSVFEPYFDPVMMEFAGQTYKELIADGNVYRYHLQPLKEIYLRSDFDFSPKQGDLMFVLLFSIIGLLILAIAYINFVNLTVGQASIRLREIGIKKAMGSTLSQLRHQFFVESILVSLISLLLAGVSVYLLLPVFNHITGKQFAEPLFNEHHIGIYSLGAAVIVGALAGWYPAMVMTRNSNTVSSQTGSAKINSGFSRGLTVFQFSVSMILIICTLIVYQQLKFTQGRDLGYSRENVLILDQLMSAGDQVQVMKDHLLTHPEIKEVSVVNSVPSDPFFSRSFLYETGRMTRESKVNVERMWVDDNMLKTFKIPLLKGRNFYQEKSKDTLSVIISQLTADLLGLDDPIGKKIKSSHDRDRTYTVIGVIDNFHAQTLKTQMMPVALFRNVTDRRLAIRYQSTDLMSLFDFIEDTWEKFVPSEVLDATYLDDRYDQQYASEKQLGDLINVFVVIALFIASMGLLGLASLITNARRKEIGIRKVNGATRLDILFRFNLYLTKPILIAIAIGIPTGYFLMDHWLNGFAYRITIDAWVMVVSAVSCLTIAWSVVTLLTYKASCLNPIDQLRYE